MNLNIDYIRPKQGPEAATETNEETTNYIIQAAISASYPDGMDGNGPLRRMYGRLKRKLDSAITDGQTSIELEQSEKDMILEAIKKAKLPVAWAVWVSQLEDELSATVDGQTS